MHSKSAKEYDGTHSGAYEQTALKREQFLFHQIQTDGRFIKADGGDPRKSSLT